MFPVNLLLTQPTNDPFASPKIILPLHRMTTPVTGELCSGHSRFYFACVGRGWFFISKEKSAKPIVDNGEPTIGIRREEWRENCNFRRRGCDYSAGALKEDTQIFITKIADGPVTDLYKIEPEGLKFLKPITLEIPYKESGLKYNETPEDIDLNIGF